jgi:hypothetical protein
MILTRRTHHTGKIADEISMEELESAIQILKNRKAPGLDVFFLRTFQIWRCAPKTEISFVNSKLEISYIYYLTLIRI